MARRRAGALMAVGTAVLTVVAVVALTRRGSDRPSAATTPGAIAANATVDRVVDGDTVDLLIDGHRERVRLIGINTPETVARNRPVECFGPEASDEAKHLLPSGTPVRIERDVEPRDDYGRLLGYVYRAADGLFVNLELVWQGFATVLTIEPNTTHASEFVAAARAAEQGDRGLWAACDG